MRAALLLLLLLGSTLAVGAAPSFEQALRMGTHVDRVVACPDKGVQLLELSHSDAPSAPKAVAIATQDGGTWSIEEKVHFRDGEEDNRWAGCRVVAGRLISWLEFWSVSPDTTRGGEQRQIRGLSIFIHEGATARQAFSLSGTPKGRVEVSDNGGKGLRVVIGGKKVAEPSWDELIRP
ncbi:MAG: hypothetical protein IPJ65_37340 [Archangiaceae bacterium]|nr:hypothetical protein [Archangiaceae bacterium]